MSNRDRVLAFLTSIAPQDATNEQIVSRTGIRPHQQVFQITQQLFREQRIGGLLAGREWRFYALNVPRQAATKPALSPSPVSPTSPKQATAELSHLGSTTGLTIKEAEYCEGLATKDFRLRELLLHRSLPNPPDPIRWLGYFIEVKDTLGNLNNDISFLATVLAKDYLMKRFGIRDFDAAAKAQGAPGRDIDAVSQDGRTIHGEIKTTRPYQPGFGAKQREEIGKDLRKLSESEADHRLMMVTDPDAYTTLCGRRFSSFAVGIEVVNLVTGESFVHRQS